MQRFLGLALILGVAVGTFAGCQKETPTKEAKKTTPTKAGTTTGGTAAAGTLEFKGTATIKGRITYNGDGEPVVNSMAPDKDKDSCPSSVMMSGWYCDKSSDKKGIRYAVVFVRPQTGMRMPKLPDDLTKPPAGKEILEMEQPRCQFEPRVLGLGPKQDIRFLNDSQPPISHDANLSGPAAYSKTLPPGNSHVYKDLETSDREPYKVSCNQHSSFMSAFVWKFSHPFFAVTNDNGEFEIKNVPVPTNGKFDVVVWHEMLPSDAQNRKVAGAGVELKDGETLELNVAIPK